VTLGFNPIKKFYITCTDWLAPAAVACHLIYCRQLRETIVTKLAWPFISCFICITLSSHTQNPLFLLKFNVFNVKVPLVIKLDISLTKREMKRCGRWFDCSFPKKTAQTVCLVLTQANKIYLSHDDNMKKETLYDQLTKSSFILLCNRQHFVP